MLRTSQTRIHWVMNAAEKFYRVILAVAYLGLVDLDLKYPTILLGQ